MKCAHALGGVVDGAEIGEDRLLRGERLFGIFGESLAGHGQFNVSTRTTQQLIAGLLLKLREAERHRRGVETQSISNLGNRAEPRQFEQQSEAT